MPKKPASPVFDATSGPKSVNFQKILDQSVDLICSIDKRGRFIWLNQTSERLWGYCPDELTGIDYISLVLEADRTRTTQVVATIMTGTDCIHFKNTYLHKNGSEIEMVWSATWHTSEEIMYCVARASGQKAQAEGLVGRREELLPDGTTQAFTTQMVREEQLKASEKDLRDW